MGCIDIYAPGRCLTVPFLVEQIWLRSCAKAFLVTEVYDFLLRVDDERPLAEFYVASPHMCREEVDGEWQDRVSLVDVGDHETLWGWFYQKKQGEKQYEEGQQSGKPKTVRTMVLNVPNHIDPDPMPSEETWAREGLYLGRPKIKWHEDLQDPDCMMVMERIRKSLYRITLPEPLKRYVSERHQYKAQRWFRLIVEPVDLSDFEPAPVTRISLADFLFPPMTVRTSITCPFHVRRKMSESLGAFEAKAGPLSVAKTRVKDVLLDKGAKAAGTTTRIEDHRIILVGCGVSIDRQGETSDSVLWDGYLRRTWTIPCHGHQYAQNAVAPTEEVREAAHCWSGGSLRNLEKDIVSLAGRFRYEAGYAENTLRRKKNIGDLAREVTADRFREGCFLVEKMIGVGLLSKDESGLVSCTQLADTEYQDKLCQLRTIYLDSGEFPSESRQARVAFADIHQFSIEFLATWETDSRWRQFLSITMEIAAILALILSLVGLLLPLFL